MEAAILRAAAWNGRGRRQRAHAACVEAPDRLEAALRAQSHLGQKLLELWSLGGMSASAVQGLARAAVLDGTICTLLAALADLGNQGTCPQNCQRDLVAVLRRAAPALVQTVTVALPLKLSKSAANLSTDSCTSNNCGILRHFPVTFSGVPTTAPRFGAACHERTAGGSCLRLQWRSERGRGANQSLTACGTASH